MPSFELTPNDPRVGRRTPEGRQWPETDILGQPVNRGQGGLTTRSLGKGYFVVIPPGMDGEIQVALVDETPVFPPLATPLFDEDDPDAAG
ncbi:MAG: hypothetical protein K8L91_01605 [Anaerolineae bacterium]|nr:hypothetical protein [Anaerolineae bacterium]